MRGSRRPKCTTSTLSPDDEFAARVSEQRQHRRRPVEHAFEERFREVRPRVFQRFLDERIGHEDAQADGLDTGGIRARRIFNRRRGRPVGKQRREQIDEGGTCPVAQSQAGMQQVAKRREVGVSCEAKSHGMRTLSLLEVALDEDLCLPFAAHTRR
jgi:hypothetical protein